MEQDPEWQKKAKEGGWHPKDRVALFGTTRKEEIKVTSNVVDDFFAAEAKRMASTAMQTVSNSNGQTELVVVKIKDTDFTRQELEAEIIKLLRKQSHRCELTGYKFKVDETNPYLRTSLDRRNSSLGYIADNLQVVTYGANFFKSASDQSDWDLKADALERMAIAIQQRRKSCT